MKFLSRIAVYGQVNYPTVVSKVIRSQTTKKHSGSADLPTSGLKAAYAAVGLNVPVAEIPPLERTNGLRAADIAAGVPGAV